MSELEDEFAEFNCPVCGMDKLDCVCPEKAMTTAPMVSDERLDEAIRVNDDWIADYPDKVSAVDRDIALALRELREARRELEEARKDAKRWALCQSLDPEGIRYSEGEWGISVNGELHTATSLNAAIDAAIAKGQR